MAMSHEITLCSVSFHSADFLRLNERLAKALNPGVSVRWIVAENSPAGSAQRLGSNDQSLFTLVDGAGPGHIPNFHHTIALRECTRQAKTRFVAVIDPDLFVVRPHWVREMLDHMAARQLSLAGVPWHPQSKGKYRYFPAVHFSVFDTERFRNEDIDFLPDYPDGESDPAWQQGWTLEANHFARSPVARQLARLDIFRARRQFYTDTGSRLFKRWVDAPGFRYETLVPQWRAPPLQASPIGRILHAMLPDELCYEPKRYPSASFDVPEALRDASQAMPAEWERFEWRKNLFCFHVRGNLDRSTRNPDRDLAVATRMADAAIGSAALR